MADEPLDDYLGLISQDEDILEPIGADRRAQLNDTFGGVSESLSDDVGSIIKSPSPEDIDLGNITGLSSDDGSIIESPGDIDLGNINGLIGDIGSIIPTDITSAVGDLLGTIGDVISDVSTIALPETIPAEPVTAEPVTADPKETVEVEEVSVDPSISIHTARDAINQKNEFNELDWRMRLSLAPLSEYLYNDPSAYMGILQPLIETDGVIFPYMPTLDQTYYANYSTYDLTHSNYRGYFYQSSHPGELIINARFTAQDTKQANYLLATIHFLRSCTKMFYGQDNGNPHRGSPPPLVFLRGLGEYQFNEHPGLISLFNYNLPNDVDYIRAGNVGFDEDGLNKDFQKTSNTGAGHTSWSSKITRLITSGLDKGAEPTAPNGNNTNTNSASEPAYNSPIVNSNGATYVPTSIDLSFNILPVQTRDQVSNQYSMREYGNGNLLRKGFY